MLLPSAHTNISSGQVSYSLLLSLRLGAHLQVNQFARGFLRCLGVASFIKLVAQWLEGIYASNLMASVVVTELAHSMLEVRLHQ